MSGFMLAGPLVGTALLLSLSLGNANTVPPPASGAGIDLTLVRSGLLADEPFAAHEAMRTFEDRFELDPLAPTDDVVWADVGRHGLEVGVLEHDGWEGYFAMTHDLFPAGSVFHTDMEAIPTVVDGDAIGEAVFAVQTGSTKITSDVNFLAVNSYSSGGELKWQVGYSAAEYEDARRMPLGQLDDPSAPLIPDHPVGVTLRTDGHRSVEVFVGETQVLDADDLDLFVEPPLQAYLEVQAEDIAYTSLFTNFWVTSSDTLQLAGLPEGTEVRLGTAADPIASAAVGASGTAELRLPLPRAHGDAPLSLRLPGEENWRQVSSSFVYSGGDRYDATFHEGR
jgi:hypothetical protein